MTSPFVLSVLLGALASASPSLRATPFIQTQAAARPIARAGRDDAATPNAGGDARADAQLADAAVAPFQSRLLDQANAAIAKVPLEPHVKTRTKLRADVVAASLELCLYARAQHELEQIENWRKGACYADLALACARAGLAQRAHEFVQKAREQADRKDAGITQDWQRDQILSKAASALARLGEQEQASKLGSGLVESETGKVAAVLAETSTSEEFEARIAELDKLVESKQLDLVRNSLHACATLYERCYDTAALRERAEKSIQAGCEASKVPPQIRIELWMELAKAAVAHADKTTAVRWIEEIHALHGVQGWTLAETIPVKARLALLRFEAGDRERAMLEAEDQFAAYFRSRDQLQSFERAPALLSLAEAFESMQQRAKALAVCREALEGGIQVSNARPRAEGLVALLVSMATHAIEPDEALWQALAKANDSLTGPW